MFKYLSSIKKEYKYVESLTYLETKIKHNLNIYFLIIIRPQF